MRPRGHPAHPSAAFDCGGAASEPVFARTGGLAKRRAARSMSLGRRTREDRHPLEAVRAGETRPTRTPTIRTLGQLHRGVEQKLVVLTMPATRFACMRQSSMRVCPRTSIHAFVFSQATRSCRDNGRAILQSTSNFPRSPRPIPDPDHANLVDLRRRATLSTHMIVLLRLKRQPLRRPVAALGCQSVGN